MKRSLFISVFGLALISVSAPAFAQVVDTDQTDQSEEDWRKSRKKSGTTDIYRDPNSSATGFGNIIFDQAPVTPMERLPESSRRHVMRERARAIAESDDGTLSQAEFEPSAEAQADPDLAQQEQEAWDDIVGAGQSAQNSSSNGVGPGGAGGQAPQGGSPEQGQAQGQGQGQAQSPSPNAPRGGSTGSLQEIMNAIKSGQSGAGAGQSEQGQQGQQGQQAQADGAGQGQTSDGSNASQGPDNGDSGSDGAPNSSRTPQDLSPLERMRRARDDRPATGRTRSASDYLGTTESHPADRDPTED